MYICVLDDIFLTSPTQTTKIRSSFFYLQNGYSCSSRTKYKI